VGDSRGNDAVFEEILARMKQDGVSLVIHTGDIVKHCSERQYEWILHELSEAGLTVPFCAVPGNHDVMDVAANGDLLYARAFGPRRYWFCYGDTLFVGLGNYDRILEPDDLDWLDGTLSRSRAGRKDCFVFTHMPPRDPRPGANHALAESAGEDMMKVLKKHAVTALFAGHIHSYLEDEMDGIPIYITGGGGAGRVEPAVAYHYLLCTVEADGKLGVRRADVPDVVNSDYPEYAFSVKFPIAAGLVGASVLLLAGIFFARDGVRLGRAGG
jgi:3',5'-cyclic AMP phosphodiesterase CpdA